MRTSDFNGKAIIKAAVLLASILLFGAGASFAQQTINLTAAPTTTTLPDGTTVPMWGYFCGTAVTGSTATCAALNPGSLAIGATVPATWSPVVITVPTGQALTINLTNMLTFTPTGSTTPNNIPTSITIVGQVGGGLGTVRTTTPSPDHSEAQGCATWFIADPSTPPGVPCTTNTLGALPPKQGPRVQSFSTEVVAGTTTALTWSVLGPGTYLLESGTHPSIQVPMGLIGMLVVTTAPSGTTAGTAYAGVAATATTAAVPAVPYNAELPLEFSEIDPVQNKAVDAAVRTPGFNETNTKTFGDAVGSITVTNGGSGYTSTPTVTIGQPGGSGAGAGTPATATAVVGEVITGLALPSTGSGSGYTAPPTVTISGTSITTASATAVMGVGAITAPATTGTGSGYIVGDLVHFTGTGAGASGTVATVCAAGSTACTAGAILTVNVTNHGSGYTAVPTAVVGGTGASLTPVLSTTVTGTVGSVTVTAGGNGYVVGDLVTFTGTSTTAATATVGTVSSLGAILTVTITNPGAGYTAAPTATVGGTGAALTAALVVNGITVTSGGSGYTAPTATIPGPTATSAAITLTVTTAGTTGSIYAVTVTNGGSRYSAPPSVTFSAGTATALASLSQSCTVAGSTLGLANGLAAGCYPSAVNYTPFYFLINGVAFNKTNANASLFAATAGLTAGLPVTTGITGTVLVRLVNAGLRMHVPSIVGSLTQGFSGAGTAATVNGFTLIAEDGNVIPGVAVANITTVPAAPRVQTHVFMAAGKTFDVMVNAPAAGSTAPALPIYDRELSLSGNSSVRDAGMLAYIGVNGAVIPGAGTGVGTGTGVFAGAKANNDTYNGLVSGQPFTVSDPSKGVIANDVNVYGVTLVTAPTSGTLTCPAAVQGMSNGGICVNGTFTYTPNAGSTATSDSFTYCANNGFIAATTTSAASCSSANLTATVTLGGSTLSGNPVANGITYTANTSTYLKIASPGVLSVDSDPNNLPLHVLVSSVAASGVTVNVDPNGGFTASLSATPTTATVVSFTYQAQNSQGRLSAAATVTIHFPAPSNLAVTVVDAQAYLNCQGASACISALTPITDYRWIIEEDRTFWVDPNCTTNASITAAGCPHVVGPAGQSTIPAFGVQFHTSTIPYVAQGCTGPLSCEGGQTMYDNRPTIPNPANPTGPPIPNPTYGQHIAAVCDVGNGACRPDPTGNGSTPVLPSQVPLDPTKRYYISVLPGDAANPFPPTATSTGPYFGPPVCSPTNANLGTCGHTMSGAPIPPACNILIAGCTSTSTTFAFAPVTVKVLPTPLPTGKLSVMVFEDDFPLNGEQDSSGSSVIAPVEPGLGGFNIILWDTYGGLGDVTGQDTYDDFNMPLSNSLAGTIDPATGFDACPISPQITADALAPGGGSQKGITGMIVTCPKYESDGKTLSPLAGQAVIANLMPEKFSVQAYPGADRIARGEEWLQTNTLDGQHPHDSFIRVGEPGYFQEYGPAGYHVSIGFANPAIINARHDAVCSGSFGAVGPCTNTIYGQVVVQRQSRTPDQRLYPSGSRDALAWTQCWVSLGDPDGEDFMFTKCDANGNFKFTSVPGGNWRLVFGDQWNDQIIDGLSTPANVGCIPTPPATTCSGGLTSLNMGQIGVQQWQSNLYTRTFIDDNRDGIWEQGEIGIPFLYTMIHYRDGHNANVLLTDFNGIANFNETFPLFNWYVVEADSGRYKTTGIHTVYDAGGPSDGSTQCGTLVTGGGTSNGARQCGTSTGYSFLANTFEGVPLPADLSVPGAVYCAKADCTTEALSFQAGKAIASSSTASTGRIDPPWVFAEGWSGMTSQGNFIDFGKAPYASCNPALPASTSTTNTGNACVTVPNPLYNPNSPPGGTTASTIQVGENGGIHGFVAYAATRPFDDASQMIQQPWEPNVPNITVNLYQEGVAADGVTPTLKMVDTTQSASWDDWAQGFYATGTAGSGTGTGQKPYMSCPGQGTASGTNADLFFYTLFDQPNYLDLYNNQHNGGTLHTLPYNSQYKCYDAMHIWNQIQPAPYDGRYFFPSSLGIDPTTGKQLTTFGSTNGVTSSMPGTNCTVCVANPTTAAPPTGTNPDYNAYDPYRAGTPMLPPGKYVLEVIMPPGYEVYKEEDKNLLIGDNFIAAVTQQFAGLGADIFIIPDQASVASLYDPSAAGYNPNNFQDATSALGLNEELSGVPGFPGFQDPLWPCVGEMRVVPDYLSLFPQAKEVAPFAGATRPLCDRKEVTLASQMSVSAKFFIYTSTHIASKYTGVITDDFTSEFDPFAPQFGEKFAPPNMPISTRDYLGNEISRVYSDQWGIYNGLTFSSWEVNPPNITGYSPTIMVQCMNDPGPILDTRATIVNSAGATVTNPTFGQLINDPLYNSAYSDFCYEEPFMPGLTNYTDTPVVPTQAFVGAGYNNVDCAYPDTTPAIKEVDSQDGIGPWISAFGHTLTITALGDQQVNNFAYSGPSALVAPFNGTTVNRHYGFGLRCTSPTAGSATCNTMSSVSIGGLSSSVPGGPVITNWSDTSITVNVVGGGLPGSPAVPLCTIQQQAQYGGPGTAGITPARCGELVITAGNGKQSVDTVTVTIGGKAPTHVAPTGSIQGAIDAAAPGDLIIVDPTCTSTTLNTSGVSTSTQVACTTAITTSTVACTPTATTTCTKASPGSHTEMLIMWKPVRLQGVGAASAIVNANTQPAGKLLDPWRRHINCLFGLTLQGVPYTAASGAHPYDPTGTFTCPDSGWRYFGTDLTGAGNGQSVPDAPQIDRLPLEATVGWDAQLNGNLAELLQEPTLMGAYEGAGVTVLGKGVEFHGVAPWNDGSEPGAFPTGATLLSGVVSNPGGTPGSVGALQMGDANSFCHTGTYNATTGAFTVTSQTNPYPSNFICNPSSIDALTVTNSSQGGGGIFVHGWGHFLQVANNRVYNNVGTLSGGISVGQGEFAPPQVVGSATNAAPGSCSNGTGFITNQHLPMCVQVSVNVHNNMITDNSQIGDELFSATLGGGGGATVCTGNEYYKFNYNWVCGNLSAGEGGGIAQLGEVFNGDIEHNSFVFNQSTNPTIPTNGGGIQVQGAPDTDPICTSIPDSDCPPGLSDGTGPGLVINANLIQGNFAESGSGGGIRLQQVDGALVSSFPNPVVNPVTGLPIAPGADCSSQYTATGAFNCLWNVVQITNNIIANNIAGWDGGGISLQDALAVNIVNNTIMHNDTLASSGVLTNSIGSPLASAPPGNCVQSGNITSCPQSAGVTSTPNSALLTTTFAGLTGGPTAIKCPAGHSSCAAFANPLLYGNVIAQNRSFYIGIGGTANSTCPGPGCGTGNLNQQKLVSLFDAFTTTLAPTQGATGACNGGTNWDLGVRGDRTLTGHESGFTLTSSASVTSPTVVAQYCNGSRVPPECLPADGCAGPHGFGVPPGIADAVTPNPVFSLVPSATVDEGDNWINVSWGPLSLTNPAVNSGAGATGTGNWGSGPLLSNYSLTAPLGTITCINPNAIGQGCVVTPVPGNITFQITLPMTDFFGNPRPDPGTPGQPKVVDAGAVEAQGGH